MARTFGAPLTVPAGNVACRSESASSPARRSPVDLRDEVHDVRVALDLEQLGDADGARLADPAEVVARQVDEHQVLGALLLVALELVRERVVRGTVGIAPCACRRSA